MRHEWVVRFDYGKVRPWVTRRTATMDGRREAIVAIAGPDKLVLSGPRLPKRHDGRHVGQLRGRGGRRAHLRHHLGPLVARRTRAGRPRPARSSGPAARRSAGAMCAAPTSRTASCRTQPADPAAAHPRGDRRDRGGPHHVVARGLRWRAQLGLPLHLAARRRAHHRDPADGRLHRRGPSCGAPGCCAPSPGIPRTCRSCTPSTVPAGCPSASSTTCRATSGPHPCGSATARSTSARPTCSAR